MDEVRCPMCSKTNPADADACEFCGARIKPLIIQQTPEEPPSQEEQLPPSSIEPTAVEPSEQPQEAQPQEAQAQETDWLNRMRYGMGSEVEDELDLTEEEGGPQRGETDLLGRFKDLGISEEEPETEADGTFIDALIEPQVEVEPEVPLEEEIEPQIDVTLPEPEAEAEPRLEPLSPEEYPEIPFKDIVDGLDEEDPTVPDWLARIRAREEVEEVEETPPSSGMGDTDWLSGLREVSFEEDEEGELVETTDEIFPLDASQELERTLEPFTPEDSTGVEPSLGEAEEEISSTQASIEDLFSDLDLPSMEEDEELPEDELSIDLDSLASAEDELSDVDKLPTDLDSLASTEDDLSDVDALLADLELPSSEEGDEYLGDDLFADLTSPPSAKDEPIIGDDLFGELEGTAEVDQAFPAKDLFGDLDRESVDEEEPLLDAEFFADLGIEVPDQDETIHEDEPPPDFIKMVEEGETLETDFQEDLQLESIGVQDLAPGSDFLAKDTFLEDFDPEELAAALEEPSEDISSTRTSLSDLLGDFHPSWLDEAITSESDELPHVPALILDDEMPPIDMAAGEGDAMAMEIPVWLQDLGRDVEEDLIDEEEDIPVLAKATLPPWLEAMRPIESFRSAPEIELELEEEEEIIEAAGPLAGLKGVLLAEPIVAMPRTPIVALGALDISDRDLSQADILQQMVEEEEGEEREFIAKRARVPVLRWASAALLLLAVTIPSVLGFPRFKTPFDLEKPRQPRELRTTLDLIKGITLDRPVLLVFDYDPSYSAEMDAVAGALVEDLFSRDQPMISLSTQPSGPLLADRMFRRVGMMHDGINGEDYLHLGYLSGGPTALQLFATSPNDALSQGFNLPEDFEEESVWDSPLLENINNISDFAMVAIITSGTETAKNWAEQVHPLLSNTPLIMVVSAGVEPVIHPYFEAEDSQIDGILSGLPSALIYEGSNGLQADAFQRWNAYGSGALLSVLILIAGAGYGFASWVIDRFRLRQSLGKE